MLYSLRSTVLQRIINFTTSVRADGFTQHTNSTTTCMYPIDMIWTQSHDYGSSSWVLTSWIVCSSDFAYIVLQLAGFFAYKQSLWLSKGTHMWRKSIMYTCYPLIYTRGSWCVLEYQVENKKARNVIWTTCQFRGQKLRSFTSSSKHSQWRGRSFKVSLCLWETV